MLQYRFYQTGGEMHVSYYHRTLHFKIITLTDDTRSLEGLGDDNTSDLYMYSWTSKMYNINVGYS